MWDLLFCALFIYLWEWQRCMANERAKLPSDWLWNTRKPNGQLMLQNLIWTRRSAAVLPFPWIAAPVRSVRGALAWISVRLEDKLLIAQLRRDGGGSVPGTQARSPAAGSPGRSILLLQQQQHALQPLRPLRNCVCFPQFKGCRDFQTLQSEKQKRRSFFLKF